MIKRLLIVILVVGGIVFAPYFIGILINRITGLDVGIDYGVMVVWVFGLVIPVSVVFVFGFLIVILAMAGDCIKGKLKMNT